MENAQRPKGRFFSQDAFIEYVKKNPRINRYLIMNHKRMDKHPMVTYKGENLIPREALSAALPGNLMTQLECDICQTLFV